ncbi:TPA: hypothetical protein ACHKD2_004431, partial [Escherichia coli]
IFLFELKKSEPIGLIHIGMTVDISVQQHARNRFNVIFATWQSGFICPVINKNRAKNGTGCGH